MIVPTLSLLLNQFILFLSMFILGLLVINFIQKLSWISASCRSTQPSFIHSGYFYSASSSPLVLRGTPDYGIGTVLEFTHRNATDNYKWNLPKVPIWLLEWDSSLQPSGCNALNLPRYHWATTPHTKWLTHRLWVTRILVIKWVYHDANMTSILVMELTAAMGGSRPAGKQWYC